MAVGGTVVLGRVTDDVLTPAFEGERGRAQRRLHRRRSPSWRARRSAWSAWCCVATSVRWPSDGCSVLWFRRVTDRYLGVPLRWFDEHPTGELLAHADADCERSTMAMQPLPFSLGVVLLIAVSMTLLATVDWVLFGVAVRAVPGARRAEQHLHEAGRAARPPPPRRGWATSRASPTRASRARWS